MMNTLICRRWVIRGHVLGVGYRQWMRERALKLGVSGWVRNRNDGTVEAVVYGRRKDILKLRQLCGTGPEICQVSDIAEHEIGEAITSNTFEVLPTV